MVFIAGDQSAEVLEPGKQALDPPSLAVAPELAAVLRFLSLRAIGDAEGKAEVVITFGLDNLWRQFAPGTAAPERKGGAGILILGGKTKNGARLEMYDVMMGANMLVFRFERGIDKGLERDTMPYLVLELPQFDSPEETDVGLFFEEREPKERHPRFKGVEQKSVFIDEYRK